MGFSKQEYWSGVPLPSPQVAVVVKNFPDNVGNMRRGFDPWVVKTPWKKAWQPTPVLFPEESHGQKNLVGYSPWGHKELDTTEPLTL